MAFEFGMFHEFQRTVGVTDEEAFATSFEEIDAAERWRLDAMWLAEIQSTRSKWCGKIRRAPMNWSWRIRCWCRLGWDLTTI